MPVLALSITLPPVQKEVGPAAVMVARGISTVTLTLSVQLVAPLLTVQ